jgi:long-chain fatty acid transport protein
VAFNIGDYVSVGAALNINYGFLKLHRHAGSQQLMFDLGQQEIDISGWGYGATFGILVKPSDKFSIGATFRTPSKVKFSGDASISNIDLLGPMYQTTISEESEMEGDITWPMWIAAGIAVKPVENLTLTADVQYTNWEEIQEVEFDFTDQMWMTLFEPIEANEMKLHWKDATQIRFGAEYKINNLFLRAGYYIDPSPAPDETLNVLLPSHDFNAFGFGIGYAKDGLHIDFSGEYLLGKDREATLLMEEAMPGCYELDILAFTGSISFGW